MWQRIQTLYFGIITVVLCFLVFGDVATQTTDAGIEPIAYLEKTPYAVLLVLSLALNAVAIFAFGRRSLQIRLAGAAGVLLLGLQVWLAVDYFKFPEFVFRWTAVLPVVCAFLEGLAIRGIYADELLVRSSSRLRPSKK